MNPAFIAAQQLLSEFFTPEILCGKTPTFKQNETSKQLEFTDDSFDIRFSLVENENQVKSKNPEVGIPEPIDYVSIYKNAFTQMHLDRFALKRELEDFYDYYLTYKTIYSIMQQIPQLKIYRDEFLPLFSAEKLPIKYTFNITSPDEVNEKTEFSFPLHSTVHDAKLFISSELGISIESLQLKYRSQKTTSEEKSNEGEMNNLVDEMQLGFYKPYMPFIAQFIPPPPIKYRFMTPQRNVSKFYPYSTTVASVKNDLKHFLQHEVFLSVKNHLLEDNQKLSLLKLENEIIEVTFTPDYHFILPTGEIMVKSFQPTTPMYSVYFELLNYVNCSFLMYYQKNQTKSVDDIQLTPSFSKTEHFSVRPYIFRKYSLIQQSKEMTQNHNLINDQENNPDSYELVVEYSEFIGEHHEIKLIETKQITRLFKFSSDIVRLLFFHADDNIETAKRIIKQKIETNHFKKFKQEDNFVLFSNNQIHRRLTRPIIDLDPSSLISIKPTDSFLITLLLPIGERYEIRAKKTATVKEAKVEASTIFKCNFIFKKRNKDKILKDSKFLILISPPEIKVEFPKATYHFQFPNGRNKKHEFCPTLTILYVKKFVAVNQKCEIENVKLFYNNDELTNDRFLYEIDPNDLIYISLLISLPFLIIKNNKQSKKKYLSFDRSSTIKEVRQILSERTRLESSQFSFFDDNDLMLLDDKPLAELTNQENIIVIISQTSFELTASDSILLDQIAIELNQKFSIQISKEKVSEAYLKCGLSLVRLQKNLAIFQDNQSIEAFFNLFHK